MQISVTRALAELKRLDDRIAREIHSATYVAVQVGHGNQAKPSAMTLRTVKNAESKIQSDVDTIESLFKKRLALKAAIVMSNANTVVSLGSVSMTVAAAIDYKTVIENKALLMEKMRVAMNQAKESVQALNDKLEAVIDAQLSTLYGSEKNKLDASTVAAVSEPLKQQREASLIDPRNIADKIKELDEEISRSRTELDYVLSESNSKTMIEVDL